jgi:hypothetical protein
MFAFVIFFYSATGASNYALQVIFDKVILFKFGQAVFILFFFMMKLN